MTNEDRVKEWRERRRQGVSSTDPRAAALSLASVDAERLVTDATTSADAILALVLATLASFTESTVAERRTAYAAVQEGWDRGVANGAFPKETEDFLRRRIGVVVRLVETDIREGVDVFVQGYAPQTLAETDASLALGHRQQARRRQVQEYRERRRRASRGDVPLSIPMPPAEAADLAEVRRLMSDLHGAQVGPRSGAKRSRLGAVIPLFILQLHTIQAESRVALLWALFGPAVLMTLIASLYILTGAQYILNMDVPTFSLIGATTWIMFRNIVFRSSTSYFSTKPLLNLEFVTPLLTCLAQSTIYTAIYMFVFLVLITGGHLAGVITLPANLLGFLFYVGMVALGGASVGLIFGSIAVKWSYFLRFAPVIERALELFSGVFFVSEQLPSQYRKYILWCPFDHGIQLMRSQYFEGYKSQDASPAYFVMSMVFLMVVGLACERAVRPIVQPV